MDGLFQVDIGAAAERRCESPEALLSLSLSLSHTHTHTNTHSPSRSISHISSGIGDCVFVLWLWWCFVDCDDALQTTGIPPNLNPHASALGQKGSRHQQPGEGTGLVVVVVVVVAAAWSVIMSSP